MDWCLTGQGVTAKWGWGLVLGWRKKFGTRWRWWLHIVSVLSATLSCFFVVTWILPRFFKKWYQKNFFQWKVGGCSPAASGPGKMRGASATMMSARAVPVHPSLSIRRKPLGVFLCPRLKTLYCHLLDSWHNKYTRLYNIQTLLKVASLCSVQPAQLYVVEHVTLLYFSVYSRQIWIRPGKPPR